jgi:hypothetical protein
MKKPRPDNVSNAFLTRQIQQKLAAFLPEVYAEGRAEGLTPGQVTEMLLKVLDEFKADWDSR